MSLKLILGCMYSGKTTEILRIVNSLKHINEKPNMTDNNKCPHKKPNNVD